MTMVRSARWNDIHRLEVGTSKLVAPEPNQVQIAVGSVGICGSDLHFYRGEFTPQPGVAPGHELAGTVSAIGREVQHVKEGDLVGVEPILRCGFCAFCASGDYHVCSDRGLVGEHQDGGMSEFTTVASETVFKAPTGLDAEVSALAEPLACSVHGFHKVNLRGHQTVFILGAGSIGLTAILAARALGAATVVLARHPHQQAAARRLGANEVIGEDESGQLRMKELRATQAIDIAVETVGGTGDTLMQAQRMVRPKGRVLVLGVFSAPTVNINPLHLALKEVEIVGSMTYSASDGRADYQIALDILSDYAEAARSLITHRFDLADVTKAFDTALDKATQSIKVHLNPGGAPA